MKRTLLLASLGLALAGCATLKSLQPGAGGTTFQVKRKTYAQIWNAAIESTSAQLTIVQSDKTTGSIKAEREASLTSWGEVVGVFIHPVTPNAPAYSVEVESLKRARGQITGEDWTQTVVAGMQARLGQ